MSDLNYTYRWLLLRKMLAVNLYAHARIIVWLVRKVGLDDYLAVRVLSRLVVLDGEVELSVRVRHYIAARV